MQNGNYTKRVSESSLFNKDAINNSHIIPMIKPPPISPLSVNSQIEIKDDINSMPYKIKESPIELKELILTKSTCEK